MKKLTFVFLLICIGVKAQQTIHVPADTAKIQDAINIANPGDIILVDSGIYYEQINFLGKAITVTSRFYETGNPEDIENTVISGEFLHGDSSSVVMFISGEDTTSVINGFTIREGKGTLNGVYLAGGGVLINHSGAKITNNRITHNILNGWDPVDLVTAGAAIATPYEADNNWIVISNNTLDSNQCISNNYDAVGGAVMLCCNVRFLNNNVSFNDVLTTGTGNSYSAVFLKSLFPVPYNTIVAVNNTISYNTAISDHIVRGGGIICALVNTIIEKNAITNNTAIGSSNADYGGAGIYIEFPISAMVTGNIITDNYTSGLGGGLSILGHDTTYAEIRNNHFQNNEANTGGAIHINRAEAYISNNIFIKNTANDLGGAIDLSGTTPFPVKSEIVNNSFYENTSVNGGNVLTTIYHKAYILNSIFWNNFPAPTDFYFTYYPAHFAYSELDTTKIFGTYTADMIIKADPMFCDSTTLEISFNESPCKNTGTASYTFPDDITLTAPADDIRYWPRPLDGGYDMGAWEASGVGVKERSAGLDFQVYPNPAASQVTLSYSLTIASTVFVELYDISGRLIKSSKAQLQAAGQHQATISISSLPEGIYSVRLLVNDLSGVRKVVVVR